MNSLKVTLSSVGAIAVSGEPSVLNGVHINSCIFLASSAFDNLKYNSTSEVPGIYADKRTSNAAESFASTIGLVIYFAAELPPLFAVSATKSTVVPEAGLNR